MKFSDNRSLDKKNKVKLTLSQSRAFFSDKHIEVAVTNLCQIIISKRAKKAQNTSGADVHFLMVSGSVRLHFSPLLLYSLWA